MAIWQRSNHSTKTRTARDGDEMFNYKEFKDAAKKFFDSLDNNEQKYESQQETKPSYTESSSSGKKSKPTPQEDNSGNHKSQTNPLNPIGSGIDTLRQIKTELGYSVKPIYQTMVKGSEDFVVDQARDVIGAATGNQMRQGKEYRMAMSILGLGNEIFLTTALSMKKGESIHNLKEGSDELVASINKTLVNKKISANENFEIKRTGDIKNLKRQMDIYVRKFAKTEGLPEDVKKLLKSKNLSQMSKTELNSLLDKLMTNKGGNVFAVSKNKDLINMVKMSMDLKDSKIMSLTAGGKRPSIRKKGSRILKTALEDDAGYKGYRKTKETYAMAKIMMKATLYEGKLLYKSTKALGNGITKGGAAIFKKVGLEGVSNVFTGMNQFGSTVTGGIEKVASLPGKGLNAGKGVISNAGQRVNQAARNTARRATKPIRNVAGKAKNATGRTINKGVRIVGNKTTKVIQAGAKKFLKKDIKSESIKKVGKAIGSKLGAVAKAPLKIFQFASKAMSAIQALLKKLLFIVVKFIVGLFIACGGILILLAGFLALASAAMFVLECLSDIIGERKRDSSMNAAYEKLLEKEALFSSKIQSVTTTVEIPQEYQEEYGITEYTDQSIAFIDGTGGETKNTSTIKQILAMAAVYIEQDFNKYGAFLDGKLTDSVYKDYCAKLYDATHIIAVAPPNPDGSGIYYCSSETVTDEINGEEQEYEIEDYTTESGSKAMENCNNKTQTVLRMEEPSQLDEDNKNDPELQKQWEQTLEEYKKEYSAVLIDEGRRKREDKDSDYEWINNGYYTVVQSGPHGVSKTVRLDEDTEDFNEEMEEAKQQLIDKGCSNPYEVLIRKYIDDGDDDKDSSYEKYQYVCTCETCKGHLDATTYVFISNIYDPSRDAANGEEGYNEINADYEEMPYSMYALDKYATAFDGYVEGNGYFNMYCSNADCDNHNIYTVVNLKDNMEPTCALCGSQLTMANKSNPGDKASCEEGDSNYSDSDRYKAEKAVMDDITGKDCTIVTWWDNDGWFQDNFFTTETYFRLLDDGDISKAVKEREEDKKNQAEIENNQGETTVLQPVVNKNNSTTYKFQSFTSSSGRNTNFEKHGWDKSSIEQVQLLLAADWKEAYGMSDFGGISTFGSQSFGTALSDEELQQLIANNPSWDELCDDRKALMITCTEFYNEILRLKIHYHGGRCTADSIDELKSATSDKQYFTKGTGPICPYKNYPCSSQVGIDCSGFVCWIIHATFGDVIPKKVGTSSMVDNYVGSLFEEINKIDLKPGDIALRKSGEFPKKSGHTAMYLGGGLWAEASGHGEGVVYNNTWSQDKYGKIKYYRITCIDEDKFTATEEDEEENEYKKIEENDETGEGFDNTGESLSMWD